VIARNRKAKPTTEAPRHGEPTKSREIGTEKQVKHCDWFDGAHG